MHRIRAKHGDATLLGLAPLIYVAWSDGTLTESEIARIRQRLSGQSEHVQAILDEWLDPAAPPSAAKLNKLLELMRSVGSGEQPKRFKSLAEFGRFLAFRSSKEANDNETPELVALSEVEEALGIVGTDALRAIMAPGGGLPNEFGGALPNLDALRNFVDGERQDIHRLILKMLERAEFERTGIEDMATYRQRVFEWCQVLAQLGVGSYG